MVTNKMVYRYSSVQPCNMPLVDQKKWVKPLGTVGLQFN